MDMGIGAGLAAMAFWGFIAVVVVGGMWYSIREKESRQETLRRLIESGQVVDETVADKLLAISSASENLDRDLRVSAYIILPLAVGMAALGAILAIQYPEALTPLLGVAALLVFIGVGLLMGARVAENWNSDRR